MNASGRRCREFKNGFRALARICGKAFAGGRRVYGARSATGSVAAAIERERAFAKRQAAAKSKKKK